MENGKLYERIATSFAKQSFLSTIGARLESAEHGRVVISCTASPNLNQQNGFMHAGVISTIADVACGYAAMSTAPGGCNVMSVEFKMNLMRPMTGKRLSVTGNVVKSGKTLTVTEAEAVDTDSGKTVAKMLSTMIITAEK